MATYIHTNLDLPSKKYVNKEYNFCYHHSNMQGLGWPAEYKSCIATAHHAYVIGA